jgi:hypothetical protein
MRGFDPRRRKFGFRFITFSPYFNILALRLQKSERGLTAGVTGATSMACALG